MAMAWESSICLRIRQLAHHHGPLRYFFRDITVFFLVIYSPCEVFHFACIFHTNWTSHGVKAISLWCHSGNGRSSSYHTHPLPRPDPLINAWSHGQCIMSLISSVLRMKLRRDGRGHCFKADFSGCRHGPENHKIALAEHKVPMQRSEPSERRSGQYPGKHLFA